MKIRCAGEVHALLNTISRMNIVNDFSVEILERFFLRGEYVIENVSITQTNAFDSSITLYLHEPKDLSDKQRYFQRIEALQCLKDKLGGRYCSNIFEPGGQLLQLAPSFKLNTQDKQKYRLLIINKNNPSDFEQENHVNHILKSVNVSASTQSHCEFLVSLIRDFYKTDRYPILLTGVYGDIDLPFKMGCKLYFWTRHMHPYARNSNMLSESSNIEKNILEYYFDRCNVIHADKILTFHCNLKNAIPNAKMSFWGVNAASQSDFDFKVYYEIPAFAHYTHNPREIVYRESEVGTATKKLFSLFNSFNYKLRFIGVGIKGERFETKYYFFPNIEMSC